MSFFSKIQKINFWSGNIYATSIYNRKYSSTGCRRSSLLISENKQSINISSLFQLSFILWFKNYETELYICTIFSISLWRKFNFEISVIQTLQKCIFSDSFKCFYFSKIHLKLFLEYWKHLIKIQRVEIKIKIRGLNTCLLHSTTTALISFFEPPGTDCSNQTIK